MTQPMRNSPHCKGVHIMFNSQIAMNAPYTAGLKRVGRKEQDMGGDCGMLLPEMGNPGKVMNFIWL